MKDPRKGKDQEGTQDEPEGRKGLEGRGGRSLGWDDHSASSRSSSHPLLESVPGPDSPKSQSCWHCTCSGKVPFAVSLWSGEVSCVGLQVSGSPGFCLGDDWQAGKHTFHFPFVGRSAASGVGNWKIRGQYLFRDKEIYSQTVSERGYPWIKGK